MNACPVAFQALYFEQWRKVTSQKVGEDIIDDRYIVSNFGRVYDVIYKKFLNIYISNQSGYCTVRILKKDGTARHFYVHRLILMVFDYNFNYNNLQGNHIDGDKQNNWINNLEWATPQQNSQHAIDTGLNPCKGENCRFAKITNEQAEKIAQLLTTSMKHKDIANIVGCSPDTVECIMQGLTWKDLYKKYNLEKYKQVKNGFTDEQVDQICSYIIKNKDKYINKEELYKNTIRDLFNREITPGDRISIIRYINHQTRKNITDKYTF